MRAVLTTSALIVLGFGLSGCAVAEAGGAVVGTAASVAGDVISAPVDVLTGGSDDSKKSKD